MAADTYWEYVILIVSPRKQRINESASMLRDTYIACLVGVKLDGTYSSHQALNG
jgi:hypothetical protein